MTTSRSVTPLALLTVLAAFLAAACSGGGGDAADAGATPTPRAIAQSRGTSEPPNAIDVWLGDFTVMPWRRHVSAGGVYRFVASNRGQEPHDLAVVRWDRAINSLPSRDGRVLLAGLTVIGKTDVIDSGLEVDLEVDLDAGRYVLVSSRAGDFGAGMAATFTVASTRDPSAVEPVAIDGEGVIGVYLDEYAILTSTDFAVVEEVTFHLQNIGERSHDLAVVQWRGDPAALPVLDGRLLIDGLTVLGRIADVAPGEEADLELTLETGITYAVVSTVDGEYQAGMVATVEIR